MLQNEFAENLIFLHPAPRFLPPYVSKKTTAQSQPVRQERALKRPPLRVQEGDPRRSRPLRHAGRALARRQKTFPYRIDSRAVLVFERVLSGLEYFRLIWLFWREVPPAEAFCGCLLRRCAARRRPGAMGIACAEAIGAGGLHSRSEWLRSILQFPKSKSENEPSAEGSSLTNGRFSFYLSALICRGRSS